MQCTHSKEPIRSRLYERDRFFQEIIMMIIIDGSSDDAPRRRRPCRRVVLPRGPHFLDRSTACVRRPPASGFWSTRNLRGGEQDASSSDGVPRGMSRDEGLLNERSRTALLRLPREECRSTQDQGVHRFMWRQIEEQEGRKTAKRDPQHNY